MVVWCSATLFASASLLFCVEAMFARMVLPRLGGGPAVWNTTMMFFQGAFLAGYAYAHATSRWLRPAWRVALHLLILAFGLLALPAAVEPGPSPSDLPQSHPRAPGPSH
jgi:hypothetical protein